MLKSLNDRRSSGNNLLRRLHFLRTEANFIKLKTFRVAEDKDIPCMDQIAQRFRDQRRQPRGVWFPVPHGNIMGFEAATQCVAA